MYVMSLCVHPHTHARTHTHTHAHTHTQQQQQQQLCGLSNLSNNFFRKSCIHKNIPYSGKVWRIDSFRAFGERKLGELIDQPIDY